MHSRHGCRADCDRAGAELDLRFGRGLLRLRDVARMRQILRTSMRRCEDRETSDESPQNAKARRWRARESESPPAAKEPQG